MKTQRLLATSLALLLVFTATGCFRVSSDTRALPMPRSTPASRTSQEKIEFGVGFFTVGLAKLATKFVDIQMKRAWRFIAPKRRMRRLRSQTASREPQLGLGASRRGDGASRVRTPRRVIQEKQLVAVYIPTGMSSTRYLQASILVLDGHHLVCASAEANAEDLIELATSKMNRGQQKG
jgi:hypothetical protein